MDVWLLTKHKPLVYVGVGDVSGGMNQRRGGGGHKQVKLVGGGEST